MLKELATREADGGRVTVTLYFDTEAGGRPGRAPLRVSVLDVVEDRRFTLYCDVGAQALEAFAHPFAFEATLRRRSTSIAA